MAVTGKKINELDSLSTVSNQTVLPAVYIDGSTVNSTAQKISVSQISNKVQSDMSTALANKQDLLTAGNNITISNNIISATDTTYTAGDGISIQDNVISATGSAITVDDELSLSSENPVQNKVITASLNDKQDKLEGTVYTTDNLIAGTNISITQVPAPIIDQYTKALWNFEEGTADVISSIDCNPVYDYLGKLTQDTHSKFGNYGATGQCIYNLSTVMSSATRQVTIDWWEFRTSSSNSFSDIYLTNFTNVNARVYLLGIDSGYNMFYVNNSGTNVTLTPPSLNTYIHRCLTLDTTTGVAKYFQNGILQFTKEVTPFYLDDSNNRLSLWIKSGNKAIDEIRVSDTIRWTENFTPFNEPYTEGGSSVFQINNTLDISKQVSSDTIRNIVSLTQAQYDTLAQESAIDANTFYIIVE